MDALRVVEENGYEKYMNNQLPFIISASDLKTPYHIIKNLTQVKKDITKEDFVNFYNSRYGKIRDIIVTRVPKEFTSINKVDSARSEIYVIGIVREIRKKDNKTILELEDKTGSVPVIFDEIGDVEHDDVIAVRAITGGKVLFGKKIIYPDIPLRSPTTGKGRACFVSDLYVDKAPPSDVERFFRWFSQQDIPYLFVAGGTGDKELFEKHVERYCYAKTVFVIPDGDAPKTGDSYNSSRIVPLSNPAMLDLGGLKILIIRRASVTMLKKRHLGKPIAITDEDYLVLDDVPDIVHGGQGPSGLTNYKSVTITSSGSMLNEFRPVVINFTTREAERVTLKS